MSRVLVVGLDRPEVEELRTKLTVLSIANPLLPVIRIDRGSLLVQKAGSMSEFLKIDKVIYHGIFENDFDFITALALWRGPCLPDAAGMMRCRLRIPCLAESLSVTRYNAMPRGWVNQGSTATVQQPSVAKWGNWHCGENKERFDAKWEARQPTIVEEFISGEAVRIMLIGDRYWLIRLTGETWLKSIHPEDAAFVDARPDLLEDTRKLAKHFNLRVCGVDYMIASDGTPHLLEVNHIPNVTRFPEVRTAYLDLAAAWANEE